MSAILQEQPPLQLPNRSGSASNIFARVDASSSLHHFESNEGHKLISDSRTIGPAATKVPEERDEKEEEDDDDDDDDAAGDISVLHDNIMKQSRTIDDFTRIIADWRNEREQRHRGDGASMRTSFHGGGTAEGGAGTSAAGGRGLQVQGSSLSLRRDADNNRLSLDLDAASQYSYEASSVGDADEMATSPAASLSPLALQGEGTSSNNVKIRCTCCCGRGTRRCKRARRATREWSEMESDLRLAAEIGQALLKKNDALQVEMIQNQQEYSSRVDSLMKKLSLSIREASQIEKNREQSELNLEAAEASNRSLVRELDETRREMARLRGVSVKNTGLDGKLERSLREVADLKQELIEERKKFKRLEKVHTEASEELRIAKIEGKRQPKNEEERALRRKEMRLVAEARVASSSNGGVSVEEDSSNLAEGLAREVDKLQQENAQLKDMLESRGEELQQLRQEWVQPIDFATSPLCGEEIDEESRRMDSQALKTFGALSSEIIEDYSRKPTSTSYRSGSTSPSRSVQSGSERQSSSALLSPAITSESTYSPAASINSTATADTTVLESEGANRSDRTSTLLAAPPPSTRTNKENRTGQLMALVEMVQRILSRLSQADVDTLTNRLQKQNLTGDVGHLARTTVNGILRDVDGLREHFRKGLEAELRHRDVDTASLGSKNSSKSERDSESLIARKEFFVLIKIFRELFVEIIRLRKAVNEVSLQPQNAARILQEHLGVNSSEDKGMGAWIGRLFAAAPIPGVSSYTNANGGGAITTPSTSQPTILNPNTGRPITARVTSGPQVTSRASAVTAVPSTVAVEVKGTHASEQSKAAGTTSSGGGGGGGGMPSHARAIPPQRNLSRTQSRNLSGLFVGSLSSSIEGNDNGQLNHLGPPHSRFSSEQQQHNNRNHRLSRIVDDDEVSIQHSFTPKRGLRPRNLSDSSIRATYMEDEDKVGSRQIYNSKAPTPISRIITPSTLSLQASPLLHDGVVHSYTSSSALSDASNSTLNSTAAPPLAAKEAISPGFLSSLAAPRSTVSKALSFLSTPTTTSAAKSIHPPTLRSTSSSAKLSLAAVEGNTPQQGQKTNRTVSTEDVFRVGQNRARDMGF